MLSTIAVLSVPARADSERPNVLFIAVDDMNDWVGCLGGYPAAVVTPHIDRLAASGTLFTNAHCPSPLCAPSRAAVLTGLFPSTSGIYGNQHWWFPNLPEVDSLPQRFRDAGYTTLGAGKIFHHTAGNHPPKPWDRFQRLTYANDPWFRGATINYPWSTPEPFPEEFPFSAVPGLGHENDWGDTGIPERDYEDERSADFAIKVLKSPAEAPFFLACGFFRPHLPWYVPQRFFDLYPLDAIQLPQAPKHDLDDLSSAGLKLAAARRGDFDRIRESGRWRHAIQAYLAAISYADHQVGRVLTALNQGPHAGNTIVVFWSDHGWHLGEKRHWHKGTLWEEATRVPLIIRAPGLAEGRCDRPVSLIDLYPTLTDLAGLNGPDHLDGQSLQPLLENPQRPWSRPARVEFGRGNAAVRSQRYRLIQYHDGSRELYDHATDPQEWVNRRDDPDLASVRRSLVSQLPTQWAPPRPSKAAFDFDPTSFTWTHKETGTITRGVE